MSPSCKPAGSLTPFFGVFHLLLMLFILQGCNTATFSDISPNLTNPPTAGLTVALTGSDGSLYAVSLNAGVWHRSVGPKGGKPTWSQLGGPRYALSIAVDPKNPKHIAVGERDGDGKQTKLNEAGLWESEDYGATWYYAYNPMEYATGSGTNVSYCPSQVINAVTFTAKSSLLIATTCGIARRYVGLRIKGLPAFTPSVMPPGIDFVTAIVAGATKIWARTYSGILLLSTDDGISFSLATNKPLPDGVGFYDRGDPYTLAASDDIVMMSGCCATSGLAPINGHFANELVIYHPGTDNWSIENFVNASGATITSGTYLGGRRFLHSFITATGTRFFFCNGQAIWEVNGMRMQTMVASSGVDVGIPADPKFDGETIHTDFWDFALDPSGAIMWLGCDGGVYENRLDGTGWKANCDGLHTQHVQSLDVALDPKGTYVSYGTQDNNGWYSIPPSWRSDGTGDVNWTDADAGNAGKLFYYRSFADYELVQADGSVPPVGSLTPPASLITDPSQPDRPGIMQFIQSVTGETNVPLDAYVVVQRPVMNTQKPATPVVPPPGLEGLDQPGNPWLLRNRKWEEDFDFYRGLSKGNWIKELDDLPVGTERVLTSGGHTNTQYFAIVRSAKGLSLYQHFFQPLLKHGYWTDLFDGIIDWTTHCEAYLGSYGPVFVNPYDASKIYLLAPDGVKVSHPILRGNLAFRNDDILTALITASGTYPIVGQFCGGNRNAVVMASRVLGNYTLGNVSFFRDDPKKTIVSSPFTGAFLDCGDGLWRSFSNLLPPGYVWSARMDKENAYIGFAGRSIGVVKNADYAAVATYFVPEHKIFPHLGGEQLGIATLQISNGKPAAGKTITLKVVGQDGKIKLWDPARVLDNNGELIVNLVPFAPGSVVHLHFIGSEKEGLASSEIHFTL